MQSIETIIGFIILVLYFILVPMTIGISGSRVFCRKKNVRISEAYIWGNIILWAIFQVLCVPMGMLKIRFDLLVITYVVVIFSLCVMAAYNQRKNKFHIVSSVLKVIKNWKRSEWLLATLILTQICVMLFYITSWGSADDACYIATSLDAVERNSIAGINYYTGVPGIGVSLKIVLTSWNYYISFLSKISGLHVAIVARSFLPIILVTMSYMVYFLIANIMFKHNRKKRTTYLLFLTFLFVFGGYTTYNLTFRLDICVWEGKAVMATIMLPFLFYYLLQSKEYQKREWIGQLIIIIATCAMSLMGVGLSVLMILGIVAVRIRKGNLKKFIPLLIIALATSVIAAYYYFSQYALRGLSYEEIKRNFSYAVEMALGTNVVYWGNAILVCLYMVALIYLCCRKGKNKIDKILMKYVIAQYLIIYNPIVYYIAYLFLQSSLVYVRLYYILFPEFYLAYALTLLIHDINDKKKRRICSILFFLFIVVSGRPYWKLADFLPAENMYKIPQEVIEICDIINADSTDEIPRVLVADDMCIHIRQYSSRIELLYGRGGAGYSYNGENLYVLIQEGRITIPEVITVLKDNRCKYLVWENVQEDIDQIEYRGGRLIGETENYCIFKFEDLDQYIVTQYASVSNSQSLIYTITDYEGHLIIIDGGWKQDADQMLQIIKDNGGKVDAWIITHPHPDHVGCFNVIYESGIVPIDTIYTIPMNYAMYKNRAQWWDEFEVYDEFRTLTIDEDNIEYLREGDTFELFGLDFEVLHSFDKKQMLNVGDVCNDGGLIFRVDAGNTSMLFLGDVGAGQSQNVLNNHSDRLKADYVQMGHHGNGGMSEEVYQMISPEVAFFDAPQWLMEDETRNAPRKRELMESLGAEIYSYQTAPNYVILE